MQPASHGGRRKGYAVERERIVAFALLTESNMRDFGSNLHTVYPIDETPCFGELLSAIDEADREMWRERDRMAGAQVYVVSTDRCSDHDAVLARGGSLTAPSST